jgi:excisionase family DNA binding protein
MMELYYSTADLSEMMQVGKSTIKRWTKEGKLKCFRTPGGHRKFRTSDVHRFLDNYHYEISPAFRPKFPPNNIVVLSNSDKLFSPSPEKNLHRAIKNNHQLIEQEWKSAFLQNGSIARLFDDQLTPLLRLITAAYHDSKISSVEFQIAKNTLIHALINVVDSIPNDQEKHSELYCLSVYEGMNEVELKAVELLLEHNGYTVYNLGAVMTTQSAEEIVHQCKPEDLFVVLSQDHSSDKVIRQYDAIVAGVTSYGGTVYTSDFSEERQYCENVSADSRRLHSFSEIDEKFIKADQSVTVLPVQ